MERVEEADVPLEHLHERVQHSAEHGGEAWISWVALSTAVLAVFAAITGLLSGKHANEAMMNQIEASDQWSYYQAKSIKAALLDAKMSLATVTDEKDGAKAARYEEEQTEIKSEAERKQADAKSNFRRHEVYARGVTMFQIAIAVAAISALTKKRRFWLVSLLFGAAGCVFIVLAASAH
jgi:hypothetical protein